MFISIEHDKPSYFTLVCILSMISTVESVSHLFVFPKQLLQYEKTAIIRSRGNIL